LASGFDLKNAAFFVVPFRYATFERCLDSDVAERVLLWFESTAPWHHVETDFYEQHEFSCWDSAAPEAACLISEDLLGALRADMTRLFGCQFRPDVSVVAHRLVPGHRIGIHNDYLVGQETHRFVVQLNRGLSDADGGFFMLFGSSDPADVHKVMRPASLSALAFEISPSSYHAISQMHGNVRYSIVFSLYASTD
jgi:hypothetical protein